ncbi:MFS transporter [Clostridium tyrobutyricum]|uniref:MFS transporter n=1 Tax=Clostridium tyrobutyricum TaxID=1519 RepID=UPI002B21D088|nr:MFS transporter [Clostridium tyrobutyricum]MEA5007465.1 MFS transporter [Clostridium tyrobutyricum]
MNKVDDEVYRKRWIILFTVLSFTFMATLDGSIVNVALPDMSSKLNVSMAGIEWVVTGFLMTISATILIFGRFGDIKGKTRIFRYGIVLFTIGSLLCGLTHSLIFLIAARTIQGIGAGAAMANSQGIITQVFPVNERGSALGILGTFVALGAMAGPPLGGVIVSAVGWEYIFLINVPIGIAAFIMTIKVFPKAESVVHEKFDSKGAVFFMLAVILFMGAFIQGQSMGYDNVIMISCFVISIISFVLFIIVESKVDIPLIQLKIFNNSLFSIGIVCGFLAFVALSAFNIIIPFYFQDSMKLSPALTGLFMMVSPIVLSISAPLSGHLSDRVGSEIITLIGLTFMALGLLLISSLNQKSSLIMVTFYIVIMSAGNGMFQAPNNSLIMSTVPKHRFGIAGSVNALIRNVGMVIGTAVATLLLYNRMSHKIGYRVIDYIKGRDDIFIYGMRYVYIFAGVMCLLGILITGLRLYNSRINNNNKDSIKKLQDKVG